MNINEFEKNKLRQLKKKIPKYQEFNKKVELEFLKNFDELNEAFQYVRQYSKEYYQIREFLQKQLYKVFLEYYYFSKSRKIRYKNYINYKKYLQNEIKPIEENIERIG